MKKLIPDTKKINNNTLLEAEKKGKSLKVTEMFSDEAYELLEKGKMMGLYFVPKMVAERDRQ
ncbi:MAG: hypothetical protein HFI18_14980 [Lachnospiraceae bacterium]|nr:hypothetical protein [Lachnospiraceae bacterium]